MIELQDRLTNWARWARPNGRSVGHCASIEYRYRSPQHWWPEEAKTEVDILDAVKVEKAIIPLPIPYQKPLVLFWVIFRGKRDYLGSLPQDTSRIISTIMAKSYKIGLNRNKVWERISEAQNIVLNRLTREETERNITGDNLRKPDELPRLRPVEGLFDSKIRVTKSLA